MISVRGRPISNLHFADDVVLLGCSNNKLQDLTNRLAEQAYSYGMEVSAEKNKVLVSSADITMNRQKLKEVDAFEYLSSAITQDDRSLPKTKVR